MRVVLIRHYATPGNKLGRYIGITDEDLEVGTKRNEKITYPTVDQVYVSPLKRCIQTAQLIYPEQSPMVCDELRECNFGRFENKNYLELSEDATYQKWVDSMGKMPFPEGEDSILFRKRCVKAFLTCVKEAMEEQRDSIAMVVHGGTIMSILEKFDIEKKEFYDYRVKNGHGYVLKLDDLKWMREEYEVSIEQIL